MSNELILHFLNFFLQNRRMFLDSINLRASICQQIFRFSIFERRMESGRWLIRQIVTGGPSMPFPSILWAIISSPPPTMGAGPLTISFAEAWFRRSTSGRWKSAPFSCTPMAGCSGLEIVGRKSPFGKSTRNNQSSLYPNFKAPSPHFASLRTVTTLPLHLLMG